MASDRSSVCKACECVARELPLFHLYQRTLAPKHQKDKLRSLWKVRLSEFVTAVEAHCDFCTFVVDKFLHCNKIWVTSKEPCRPWFRKDAEADLEHRSELLETIRKISAELENDEFEFSLYPSHSGDNPLPDFNKLEITAMQTQNQSQEVTKKLFHIGRISLEVFCTEDDPASKAITTRPQTAAPASDESFQRVRSWLQECVETHPRCGTDHEKPLPSRVIDVGDGKHLRLDTSRGRGRYAALSYCWGGLQNSNTLTTNLEERINGFEISELELTLQDAVRVTQKLGLQYLWIDAQCILQDSAQDKEHEVSQMVNIYKNAHVTICAAKSSKASDGFLEDTRDEETKLPSDLIPFAYRRPVETAVTAREAIEEPAGGFSTLWVREHQPESTTSNEPVMKRAWTLQERLLSPRFLHYGTRLIWQCNRMQRCDGGVELPNQDMIGNVSGSVNRSLLLEGGSLSLFTQQQLFEAWYQIVHDYTKRALSDPTDKLPGIAGIAKEISRLSGVAYMVGLWKNNLLHDLMWTSNDKERFTRPKVWRAPTWSWASVNSVVSYKTITADAIEEAEVVDCQVEPSHPQPSFETVTSGRLKICGPMALIPHEDIRQLLRDQSMGPAPPKSNDAVEWNTKMLEFFSTLPQLEDKDKESDELGFEEVFCLVTHSRHWTQHNFGEFRSEKTCYFGLILGKNEEGHFERLGSFDNQNKEWMKNCTDKWDRKAVTLV
ncbi:hypothetical protein BP5796_02967 [Coleophoma crateriformis]|uniref:Heterokaryon incompatibility domain-containing protein n=1 Tax=Coleophoma crateriformis TaxID=565419 RepID=A0A3D8SLT3_9HELO|nr:hypothetical protein BP5796_02967 [Coleophoma crateriformis]